MALDSYYITDRRGAQCKVKGANSCCVADAGVQAGLPERGPARSRFSDMRSMRRAPFEAGGTWRGLTACNRRCFRQWHGNKRLRRAWQAHSACALTNCPDNMGGLNWSTQHFIFLVKDGVLVMCQRYRRGFTAAEKTELWDRWKRGESLKAIGRASISRARYGTRARRAIARSIY